MVFWVTCLVGETLKKNPLLGDRCVSLTSTSSLCNFDDFSPEFLASSVFQLAIIWNVEKSHNHIFSMLMEIVCACNECDSIMS